MKPPAYHYGMFSKLQFLSFSFVAIFFCACEQKEEKLNAPATSVGKIKSLMESVHDPVENGGTVGHRAEISENTYLTKSSFNQNGKITRLEKFNGRGTAVWKEIFSYDHNNNNTVHIIYQFNKVWSRRISTYHNNNQLIESSEWDSEGKLIEKQVVTKDSLGNKIEQSYTYSNGSLSKTLECIYDQDGNQIQRSLFANGQLKQKEANQFNEYGDRIETIQYFPQKGEQKVMHFKYDSAHNLIETIVLNSTQMIEEKVITKFDRLKNITEQFTYGLTGNLKESIRYTYEFDEEDQWTKRITLINRKPVSVTIRRIEYYP